MIRSSNASGIIRPQASVEMLKLGIEENMILDFE
jgi:hypothetical protein